MKFMIIFLATVLFGMSLAMPLEEAAEEETQQLTREGKQLLTINFGNDRGHNRNRGNGNGGRGSRRDRNRNRGNNNRGNNNRNNNSQDRQVQRLVSTILSSQLGFNSNRGNSFGNRGNSFGNRGNSFGNRGNSFGNRGNSFGNNRNNGGLTFTIGK